jgi:transcriptional regulator with XRE-family HTH domain
MSNNIVDFCRRNRVNQKELANKLGVSNSAISEIKNKKRNPTYEQILLLAEMGATLEELFGIEYSQKMLKNSIKNQESDVLSEIRELKNRVEDLEIKTRFQQVAAQKHV